MGYLSRGAAAFRLRRDAGRSGDCRSNQREETYGLRPSVLRDVDMGLNDEALNGDCE